MRYLKYALIFFFVVDTSMFVAYQVDPELLAGLLPQFNIASEGNTYPRLAGVLFLMLGLARLYGGLYIHEKGAVTVSMWSWVVELIYTVSELAHGEFVFSENLVALILAPLMLVWSLVYYKRRFTKCQPPTLVFRASDAGLRAASSLIRRLVQAATVWHHHPRVDSHRTPGHQHRATRRDGRLRSTRV